MGEPKEIFQYAIGQGHLGLATLDAEGHYIAVNATLLAMHGWAEADLLGKHWEATVHPQDRTRAQEAYRLARTTGRGYVEVRAFRSDSIVVHQALTVTAIIDAAGKFDGYHCLRHDITGYKRDHEALSLAVEAAPTGLLILNLKGEIQSANQAVERLFGYKREELTGQNVETLFLSSFVDDASGAKGKNPVELTLALSGIEVSGMSRNGVKIPLQVYLNRIETSGGDVFAHLTGSDVESCRT